MANRVTPGAKWRYSLLAPNSDTPPIEIMNIADDYGTQLSIGDFVKRINTGYIERAAAGDTLYGVFVGMEQYWDGTAMRKGGHYPASTSYDTNFERQSKARVIPIFGQAFEMDSDTAGSSEDTYAEHLAFVGENCEWVTGTATGSYSGNLLDISTHATTNTLSLRLVGLSRHVDTDFAAVGVKWIVTGNLVHAPATGTTTGL